MEGFTVHLVSNVSPNLFPQNNPSKFSTNLAKEIDFSDGDWEVGVRHIMYPTHVSTTSAEDKISVYQEKKYYRNLLPPPPRDDKKRDLKNFAQSININVKAYPAVPEDICKEVNKSEWAKDRNLLNLEYQPSSEKFILNIFHVDIAIQMSDDLAKYLGFKTKLFTKGSHWAWHKFKKDKTGDFADVKLHLFDITTLETKSQTMDSWWNHKGHKHYICNIPRNFKSGSENLYFKTSTFNFGVYVNVGKIEITPLLESIKTFLSSEKKILFYSFDKAASEAYGLDSIYVFDENTDVNIPIQATLQPYDLNNPLHYMKNIEVTFYYDHSRDDIVVDLEKLPTASISMTGNIELKDPHQLLPKLNSEIAKPYGYSFNYDKVKKRFLLSTGTKYAIQLSQSLASILGYESKADVIYKQNTITTAPDCPILNRNITALYVYTNIIESVYVGNVRAPLLLTCPFKAKDSKDKVNQIEFLNPCYTPINRSSINQIDIAIYDDAGALIPFLYGKTKLSLDFRRKR